MTDFASGYEARWQAMEVNAATWADGEEITGFLGGSVSRSCKDDALLLESASLSFDGSWSYRERWVRVWLLAHDGAWQRHAIATLLCSRSTELREGGALSCEVGGRSVLQPCADMVLPRGSYAPKGCDGAAFAAALLSKCTPAPVSSAGSFELSDHYVFDFGCTYLEAAWKVLDAGGFCMQVDGMGCVTVGPMPTEPSLNLGAASARLFQDGARNVLDMSSVPNRYLAVDGWESATAENVDPLSPTSQAVRGRWVDMVDSNPVKINGESLSSFAARRLAEERILVRECTYGREFWPDVHPYSMVSGSFPQLGIGGNMRVLKQELTLGRGITVRETAGMEVTV